VGKKRNSGEGSIFRRSDGRWCGQLDLGWQNGGRARKFIYGRSAQEVQDALLKARIDKGQGLPVAVERQTLGQFLRDWLENTVKPSVRPSTYRSYEQTVRNHLIPELGGLTLTKLGPQHVRAVLNRRLASGLSPRSSAYLRVVLRAALNQARKWNLVARNAAELVEPPKCERFRIEPLSPEQARALLEAAKGNRLEALYPVAIACGLRMGEIGTALAGRRPRTGAPSHIAGAPAPKRTRAGADRNQDRPFAPHDRAAGSAHCGAKGSPRPAA
jgi:integrase